MKPIVLAAALCLIPVAAWAWTDGVRVLSSEDARSFVDAGKQKKSETKKRLAKLSNDEIHAELVANLSGKTAIIYQKGYGVYVEYSAPDGSDRMWFPGNRGVVKGVWGVKDTSGKPRACFHYFNSRNYVTGEFESTECVAAEQTLSGQDIIEEKTGDVFGLMNGIPYVKSSMDIPVWPADAAGTTP